MQQVDHAGAGAVHDFFERLRFIRLVIGQPVPVGKAPENRFVAQLLRLRQRTLAEIARREPEIPHGIIKVFLDVVMQLHQVLLGLLHRKPRIVGMLPAVVAHHVPLIDHPLHQCRLGLGKVPGDEENSLDSLRLQGIQNLPGKPELIPLIEGEVDLVAVLLEKDGVILPVGFIVKQGALTAVFLILGAAGPPVLAFGGKPRELFRIHPGRRGNIIFVAEVIVPRYAVVAVVLVAVIFGIAVGVVLLRLGGAGVVGVVFIVGGLAGGKQQHPRQQQRQASFFHGFSS